MLIGFSIKNARRREPPLCNPQRPLAIDAAMASRGEPAGPNLL
jgi:hypothetical protein